MQNVNKQLLPALNKTDQNTNKQEENTNKQEENTNKQEEEPLYKSGKISSFLKHKTIKTKIDETIGGKDGQTFITNLCAIVSNNEKLSKCENWSIVLSALQGAALKLSPQLQQYYLVPFESNDKEYPQAQFQIGYKGFIQLAIRSGQYKTINVIALKEREVVNYNPLTEELQTKFIDDEDIREKTATVGYYACFELINGFKKSIYWSKKKMLYHADKFSQSFHLNAHITKKGYKIVSYNEYLENQQKYMYSNLYSSFWYKNFDEMAFKTLLRQLISKWGVMSIDLHEAYIKDQSVIDKNGNHAYVDNPDYNNNNNIKDITPQESNIEEFDI